MKLNIEETKTWSKETLVEKGIVHKHTYAFAPIRHLIDVIYPEIFNKDLTLYDSFEELLDRQDSGLSKELTLLVTPKLVTLMELEKCWLNYSKWFLVVTEEGDIIGGKNYQNAVSANVAHTEDQSVMECIKETCDDLDIDYDQLVEDLAEDLECTPQDVIDYYTNQEHLQPLGAKYDQNKPAMEILTTGCPRALLAVGKALSYGARKYNESADNLNFLQVPNGYNRYTGAMMRHLLEGNIEEVDQNSGLDHDILVAVNALFRLETKLRGKNDTTNN